MKVFLINDKTFWNIKEWTILQFCFLALIENIPRFCYHEQLTVAGNCRMCLIEDLKSIKPIVSCTIIPINNGIFFTNSIKVKKARESMLEFLLINHPLDCPICCQGGECDLQDLTELAGSDKGRFYDNKRAVLDKNVGPIIKTSMNRCIHCTRCIRFSIEIINSFDLGLLGRGMYNEIGTYINNYITHEFQGNLVDICPVGALTLKIKSYNIRSWECENYMIPNIFDPFLDNIRIEIKGNKIIRVLPVYSNFWKNEWISDNYRYFFQKLLISKIKTPLFKLQIFFFRCSWVYIYTILRIYFINTLKWLIFNKLKYLDFHVYINKINNFSIKILIAFFFKHLSNFSFDTLEFNKNNTCFNLKEVLLEFSNIFKNKSYLFIQIPYLRYLYPQIYLSLNNKTNIYKLKHLFFCDNTNIPFNNNISFIIINQIPYILLGKNNISLFFIKEKLFSLTTLLINFWENWYNIMNQKYINKWNFQLYCIMNNFKDFKKENIDLTFYSNTLKIFYNIDIIKNYSYNTLKILNIYQGSFIEKYLELINIILPTSFGYELPLLKKPLIKKFFNIYNWNNNLKKKIRCIIWTNNNIKTTEDCLLLFQLFIEFFNNQNIKIINYIFTTYYIKDEIYKYNTYYYYYYYITSLYILKHNLNSFNQKIYNNILIKW